MNKQNQVRVQKISNLKQTSLQQFWQNFSFYLKYFGRWQMSGTSQMSIVCRKCAATYIFWCTAQCESWAVMCWCDLRSADDVSTWACVRVWMTIVVTQVAVCVATVVVDADEWFNVFVFRGTVERSNALRCVFVLNGTYFCKHVRLAWKRIRSDFRHSRIEFQSMNIWTDEELRHKRRSRNISFSPIPEWMSDPFSAVSFVFEFRSKLKYSAQIYSAYSLKPIFLLHILWQND